jgi:hypothetical protein
MEPKLYALDRMSDVALEDDAFEADPGLTIDDALRYSFGTMIGGEATIVSPPEARAELRAAAVRALAASE